MSGARLDFRGVNSVLLLELFARPTGGESEPKAWFESSECGVSTVPWDEGAKLDPRGPYRLLLLLVVLLKVPTGVLS